MSAASLWQYLYLAHFSKPVSDRSLYRAIRTHRPCHLLEIGLGSGQRARHMIRVAQRYASSDEVRYTGIDLFEARAGGHAAPLYLKDAHRLLKATGARTQLVPGDPLSALARTANSLRDTHLVVISASEDHTTLERAWFYLPRTLADNALVFVEQRDPSTGSPFLQVLAHDEIRRLAAVHTRRKAA